MTEKNRNPYENQVLLNKRILQAVTFFTLLTSSFIPDLTYAIPFAMLLGTSLILFVDSIDKYNRYSSSRRYS